MDDAEILALQKRLVERIAAEMPFVLARLQRDMRADMRAWGIGAVKDGKRIDPNDFYMTPEA